MALDGRNQPYAKFAWVGHPEVHLLNATGKLEEHRLEGLCHLQPGPLEFAESGSYWEAGGTNCG